MKRLLAAALGCLLAVTATAGAQQPDPSGDPAVSPELRDRLEALLPELDHTTYARREAAEQAVLSLLQSHPPLAAVLRQVAASDARPEVRTRSARALERLEDHLLFGETRVTLQLKDVHPRQAISELGRQSGVRFELMPEDPWQQGFALDRPVSMDLVEVPFWEAFRRVSQATGLAPVEHQQAPGGAMILTVHAEAFGRPPQSSQGAFVVQLRAMQMNQHSNIELLDRDGRIDANPTTHSSLVLSLRLLVEPKIRLIGGSVQPIIEEATDDRGINLAMDQNPNHHGRPWALAHNSWSVQSQVPLNPQVLRESRSIKTLRGRFELEVAREVRTVEIPLAELTDMSRLGNGSEVSVRRLESVGPHSLEVLKISRIGEQMYQVEYMLRSGEVDMTEPGAWQRLQALAANLVMVDEGGQRWMHSDAGTHLDQNGVRVTRHYHVHRPGVGPPTRIVWETPVRVQVVPVHFVFHDVPLPAFR